MATVRVLMRHSYGGNVPGDDCSFPAKLAAKLVARGAAIYVTTDAPPMVTKAEPVKHVSIQGAPPQEVAPPLEAEEPQAAPEPPAEEEPKGLFTRRKRGR
jgi:hypothetical protein